MSHSHNGKQPSRSPRQTIYDWYKTDHSQHLSIQTSPTFPTPYQFRTQAMPSPEHIEYSNTQSAKVNGGLGFSGTNSETEDGFETAARASVFNSNVPAVHINFSRSGVPVQLSAPVPPTAGELMRTLLHPPPHAFLHGVLSMHWVMGALGQSHFHFRDSDERYVLAPDSRVRTEGARLGLPPVYLEWLCGDEEESSPTEQGMLLTLKFFAWLREEEGASG